MSLLDNLIKGAAGQAIQNMNLMFDFKEMNHFYKMTGKILKYNNITPTIKKNVFIALVQK